MARHDDRRRLALFCVVLMATVTLFVREACGWGAGHGTQAHMVLEALPKPIKDFFPAEWQRKIVDEYCGYPDMVRSFDEQLLGQEAVGELKRMKITPGDLHQDRNAAISLVFLNRAFAENNPRHAAVWLGSLIHTIGDDGAHLTLIAYLAEMSRFKPNATINCGCFDLSQAAASDAGKAMLKRLMDGYRPRTIADDPQVALRKLILLAYREMDYGAQKQSRMGLAFNVDCPKAVAEDGMLALAELGAEEAQNILDATLTAWELARRHIPVRLTEEVIKQARAEVGQYLASKPLQHDSVYAGTLDSRPRGPFVGVLVEPSTFMGWARFGYCGAVLLSEIMRTFQQAGVPYTPLDIRQVEPHGLPSVEQMPVLVVCSGGFSGAEEPLRKYLGGGGKFLWIGGHDRGMLGNLSAALRPANPELLPVSNKYEDPNREVVAKVSIRFLGQLQKSLGAAPLRFVNNPNTFGWTTPRCGLQVVSQARDIQPLVAVSDGAKSMTIAAALMEDGLARHVFLPQYLLLPYALSKDPTMDFSRPRLDSVGKKIVLGALNMLAPALAKPGQQRKERSASTAR
jgi:hypothetical protein